MKYIKELEGLRGIMALWVVAGHAFAALPLLSGKISPTLFNTKAVDVFIMLSGFVIFFMLDNKKQSYHVYIMQRFFRIFPIYLVALIVSFFMLDYTMGVLSSAPIGAATDARMGFINNYADAPVQNILSHLILMQGLIPQSVISNSSFTIIGQAWSISVEWQFYLIAPFIFANVINIGKAYNSLCLVLISALFVAVAPAMDKGFLGNNILCFSIGFLTFFFYRNIADKLSKTELNIIFVVYVILSIVIMKKNCFQFILWGACFYFVILKSRFGVNSKLCSMLDSGVMSNLGKISYSIYMVHMAVIYVLMNYLLVGLNSVPMYLYVLFPTACIILSVIISMVTYQYIEKPMIKFGKKLTSPKIPGMPIH